jgi:hypothetical protein
MKKILLLLALSFFVVENGFGMCGILGSTDCPSSTCDGSQPSNDCPETPLTISACGSAFTTPAASLCNAENGVCCGYSSCSAGICYVGGTPTNCFAYEDFDCDGDDDFTAGSMENNVWWAFLPGETCTYSVSITSANYTVGSCIQWHVFNVTGGTLPGGTISSNLTAPVGCAGAGTTTFNINVTSGQYVYMTVDGNAAACADVSMSITPTANCTGCILLADDGYTHLRSELTEEKFGKVRWNNIDQKQTTYALERSYTGSGFEVITVLTSSSLVNEYIDNSLDASKEEVYYRLSKVVSGERKGIDLDVLTIKAKIKIKQTRIFDVFGKEYSDSDLPSGIVIYVTEFEDGTVQTRKEYNTAIK